MASPDIWRNKPLLFAHRGGNILGSEKENTNDAFASAVKIGCRYLETDVILTKDKKVIAYHGSQNLYMKRRSGLAKRDDLQKLTYLEINKLLHKNGERVPLFSELLYNFPNCFFSVDAKTKEVVDPLIKIIKNLDNPNRVSITSFSITRSKKIAGLLDSANQNIGLCLYRVQASVFKFSPELPLKFLKNQGIKSLHVPYSCVNSKLMISAKNNSISIYGWSVNDETEIKRLLSLDIDGIISDDIKLLLKTAKSS